MNWLALIFVAVTGLLVLAPTPARALCVCSCSVDVDPVAFGNVNPVSAGVTDTTADVTVSCGPVGVLVSYDIKLSRGSSGSYAARAMISGANTLSYNLYKDGGHTQVWGDGTGGSFIVSNGFLIAVGATSKKDTIHARVPAAATARPGAYTDSIIATVVY